MSSRVSVKILSPNQLQVICGNHPYVSETFPSHDALLKSIEPDNLLETLETKFSGFEVPIDTWGITVEDKWYSMEELAPGAFDESL